jgi:osmotically-inducible protein OsmY
MSEPMQRIGGLFLLLTIFLFQASPVLARSDDLIQQEIEAQITKEVILRGTRIEVHIEQRQVVLTGEVRLYEQKLVSDRIAWTTLGVFEVDNEIRVVPKRPVSDAAIKRKIGEIVKADERFRAAGVVVRVSNGEVSFTGNFHDFRDPSMLKHKIARIEGVLAIKISAAFLARSSETANMGH